jgi:hypothetical protein
MVVQVNQPLAHVRVHRQFQVPVPCKPLFFAPSNDKLSSRGR